jgi:serine/threonine protein kinase
MKDNKILYKKGGKVIASGGFGCVFSPALKCEGSTKRQKNKITKLMIQKYANQEYNEINSIKNKLDSIPNYTDYFLIDNLTLCKPSKLSEDDLKDYTKKCTALPKNNITRSNINNSLDKLLALNIPNGGIPVDDYIYDNGSFNKIDELNNTLIKLLKNGIVEMNKKNVYHCDIKDSNVLVSKSDNILNTRLIDWGLSTEYIPFKDDEFPKTWRNRPLQYNVPFSVIIFSDAFVEKYTKYIEDGGEPTEMDLRPFVIEYLHFWIKERGAGHYKFINEIMFMLFSNDLNSISESEKEHVIENDFTLSYIIDYIVEILIHFTRFRENGSLNLRDYLDNVFIKIVDVWGFICVYFPLLELLYNNYNILTPQQIQVFLYLKSIFVNYMYAPRIEPIILNNLYHDLDELGKLIHDVSLGKKNTDNASGINKLKVNVQKSKGITGNTFIPKSSKKFFKRRSKSKTKKFKNLFLLSIKNKNKNKNKK